MSGYAKLLQVVNYALSSKAQYLDCLTSEQSQYKQFNTTDYEETIKLLDEIKKVEIDR